MKTAQLRQSILQAAVQGKLVPQNVHDEPAEKLLERIRAEKARLVKEGKIKKEKPLPPISEDEVPYDLPDGWVWCRLGEICSHIIDIDHKMPPAVDCGVLFLSAKDLLDDGTINYTNRVKYISEEDFIRLSRNITPQKGDIIYSRIGARLGKARVVDRDIKFLVSYSCCTIRPLGISVNYLCRYLDSGLVLEQAKKDTQSIGVPDLGMQKIKEFFVPLPSLAEQQRIVAKVDELMALCDELEAAEKEFDKLETDFAEYLPKSILQAAVQGKLVPQDIHDEPADKLLERIRAEKAQLIKEGKIKKGKPLPPITEDEKPYDLPEGWIWCRLGEACDLYTGNSINATEKSQKYTGLDSGRCYIGTKDVDFNHNIDYENGIKIPHGTDSFREAPEGAVLLCIEGGSAGRKIGITNRAVCFGNKLCCFVPICIENKYLYYYLQSPMLIEFFRDGMTGIIGGVSVNSLKQLPIVIPPLAEQQRIVAKVDELMALCDELKAAKDISLAPAAIKVIPFPTREDDEDEELRIAARGDVQGLSDEAMRDIDELFGDEAND